MKNTLLLQCILCCFLLLTSIMIFAKTKNEAVDVGAFGSPCARNMSLNDLTNVVFSELFDE